MAALYALTSLRWVWSPQQITSLRVLQGALAHRGGCLEAYAHRSRTQRRTAAKAAAGGGEEAVDGVPGQESHSPHAADLGADPELDPGLVRQAAR